MKQGCAEGQSIGVCRSCFRIERRPEPVRMIGEGFGRAPKHEANANTCRKEHGDPRMHFIVGHGACAA